MAQAALKERSPTRPAQGVDPKKQKTSISNASLEWVAADAFTVDPTYDRPLDELRVNRLAETWKDEALGVVFASRREDEDRLYLLDGQHRVQALRKMGRKTDLVPTLVFDGLSVPQEAELFVLMNKNRRALKPSELFHASLAEGDPGAIEIKHVMDELGLELQSYGAMSQTKKVKCVAMVWRIYRAAGASGLDATMSLVLLTWGDPPPIKAFSDRIVLVLARILYYSEGRIDMDRLREVLAKEAPDEWLSRANSIRSLQGGDLTYVLIDVITNAYNKGLPTKDHIDAGKRRNDPFAKATHFRRGIKNKGE